MRKTKIICTLGPSSTDKATIRSMLEAGMNVARFNFSHGTHEEHAAKLATIRELSAEMGIPIATLLDTKGPEIRLRKFVAGYTELVAGSTFTLTTRDIMGDDKQVSITYQNLPNDIAKGTRILLDDGLIELRVTNIKNGTDIICTVLNNGKISDRKGVNLPGTRISMPYLSETDRNDILFGIEQGFDFVAASFARNAQDVMEIRNVLTQNGGRSIKIIAKIENAEGVTNIDQVLKTADGIMVARGDLGVEIDLQEIPILQKMMIRKCYQSGKMVITATQMLESMSSNPRPTRAEASDVANAIYDGTSAIMLSGETAAGKYPVEAVKTMATIAERVENDIDYRKRFHNREDEASPSITDAISHATCTTAHDLHATAIIPVSKSGRTARMISKYRPAVPIIACTSNESTYRQLSLSWGVIPIMMNEVDNTDDLLEQAIKASLEHSHLLRDGDLVVLTAGIPVGLSGTTNLLKVQTVGRPLVSGTGLNTLSTAGSVCVAHNNEELFANFNFGDILVCNDTCDMWMKLVAHASGIIAEQGANSHISTIADQLGIPVIFAAEGCCHILQSDMLVVMDAKSGVVTPLDTELNAARNSEKE